MKLWAWKRLHGLALMLDGLTYLLSGHKIVKSNPPHLRTARRIARINGQRALASVSSGADTTETGDE